MVAETELHAGALSFPQVLAQALTHISPGFAFLLAGTFIAAQAGYAMPLTYLFGFLICLALGLTLVVLARAYPSAGGYFTYISQALGPRAGFLTAWLFGLYDPIIAVACLTILGSLVEGIVGERLGITVPWWLTAGILLALSSAIAWRGIKISGRALVILALIEIGVLLAFAITGMLNPGPGGFTLTPFTPDPGYGIGGLALGVVYVIFAFTGFESVVPLGEESRNPRKFVPWAIIGSIVIVGTFLVVATFGLVIGWGIDNFSAAEGGFAGADLGAFFDLSDRLWGGIGWILLTLVLINSAFGIAVACMNVSTRMFFALGRAGALPAWLGKVSHRVPRNAILLQTAVSVVYGLVGSLLIGPDNLYFWTGLVVTFGVIGIYGSGAVGVLWRFGVNGGSERNIIWHFVIPIIAVAALVVVTYQSLQGVSDIYSYALPVVLGWLVVGGVVLILFRVLDREGWLINATKFAFEHEATDEELAALEAAD